MAKNKTEFNVGDLVSMSDSVASTKIHFLDNDMRVKDTWIDKGELVTVLSSEVMHFLDNEYVMVVSSAGEVGWMRRSNLVLT